jgi:hypothetical protein
MKTLFVIGNKRSGTSQLVRVLNLHSRVFVSHESDIAWILYQFHNHKPFRAHPWDSDRGMRFTLETTGNLLRREASPPENFLAIQKSIMEKGSPWMPARKKPDLQWIGDKKPMQHTDAELLKFLLEHFPDARFLHIVRHPFDVVASSDRFNRTADGDFWLGLSSEEKLARWTFHEQQVLRLSRTLRGHVHSLRYEDLCDNVGHELAKVCAFLKIQPETELLRKAAAQTSRTQRVVPTIRCSVETVRVAAVYGYEIRRPAAR